MSRQNDDRDGREAHDLGRPGAEEHPGQTAAAGGADDEHLTVGEGRRRSADDGRETVHAFPLGFTVDATPVAHIPVPPGGSEP